jgi:hypothetical protein
MAKARIVGRIETMYCENRQARSRLFYKTLAVACDILPKLRGAALPPKHIMYLHEYNANFDQSIMYLHEYNANLTNLVPDISQSTFIQGSVCSAPAVITTAVRTSGTCILLQGAVSLTLAVDKKRCGTTEMLFAFLHRTTSRRMPELAVVVIELWALVELMVAAAVLKNVYKASAGRRYTGHSPSTLCLLYHQRKQVRE